MSYICLQLLWDARQNWIGVQVVNGGGSGSSDDGIADIPCRVSLSSRLASLLWLLHFRQTPTTHLLSTAQPALTVYLALGAQECALAEGIIFQSLGYKVACSLGSQIMSAPDMPLWGDVYLLDAADLATGQLSAQQLKGRNVAFMGVDSMAGFAHCIQFDPQFLAGTFVSEFRLAAYVDCVPAHLRLIRLLTLVAEDASTEEIEEVFSQEPKLAFDLLRLVNSVAMRGIEPATTFRHAIAILGRRQLQRWIQLLLYTHQYHEGLKQNSLMMLAAQRGHLLEMLCISIDSAYADLAEYGFMVGMFSLLDVLFGIPLASILKDIPMPAPVNQALIAGEGVLGNLLKLVHGLEQGNCELVGDCAMIAGIDAEQLLSAQLKTLEWLSELRGDGDV